MVGVTPTCTYLQVKIVQLRTIGVILGMEKLLAAVFVFVMFVVIVVLMGALCALPVMWLWNGILPNLFAFPHIGFLQSWGLLILCGLLFKSSSSSSSK